VTLVAGITSKNRARLKSNSERTDSAAAKYITVGEEGEIDYEKFVG
jgi:hypothetical protein